MSTILSTQNLAAIHTATRKAIQTDAPLSLICFDLDDFQTFRRRFGFELGDQVLNHVQTVASEVFDGGDLLRAEDEDCFLCLLPVGVEDARGQAERFRGRIGASKFRFTLEGKQTAHTVTVSVGIADRTGALTAEDQATQTLLAWSVSSEQGDTVSIYRPNDRLTGLVLGRGILDALEDAIDLALSGSRSVSIIQIDVDGFGEANATLGYEVCDQFLAKLSAVLNEQFGSNGIVGRLWSDEFLIVLTDVRAEDAAFRAEDVRRRIAGSVSDAGPTSLSVGVATFPRHASNAHELMRKVREARYQSREQGGGCICVAEADQMVTKTSHFSKIQLKRLTALAKSQDRSEASVLREGLDVLLSVYEDGASNGLTSIRHSPP